MKDKIKIELNKIHEAALQSEHPSAYVICRYSGGNDSGGVDDWNYIPDDPNDYDLENYLMLKTGHGSFAGDYYCWGDIMYNAIDKEIFFDSYIEERRSEVEEIDSVDVSDSILDNHFKLKRI